MIDDQIKITIQKLLKLRLHLSDLKKDLNEEKKKALKAIAELSDLIQAKKELAARINDLKKNAEADLNTEDFIRQLREDIVLKEEEIEKERAKLFELIDKLGKNKAVEMKIECEDGSYAKFQMIPTPRVYINGKEEKSD